MFILCTGNVSENPYCIPYSGTNLYSLEELCYYIYHNIYSITEEFFTPELIEWIREGIGHSLLAKKCEEMLSASAPSLKDLVVTVLCMSDYYKEEEIRDAVKVIDDVVNLPYYSRMKIKADNYLKYGRYGRAASLYKKLLKSSFAINFTPEEYGDIMHNLGISYFYISSFHECAACFKEAFISNHKKESAEHYLYILLMEGKEEAFYSEAGVMGFSSAECKQLRREFERAKLTEKRTEINDSFTEECKKRLREAFAL